MSETLAMTCPLCDAKLRVKAEKVGSTAKCPGCRETIIVIPDDEPAVQEQEKPRGTSHLPATKRQKDFALALGCEFSDSVTREEISELIEAGKERQQEARWAEMDAMQNREQSAIDAIRKELLDEMADDPQVSVATPKQIVSALNERDLCSVLVSMPFDELESFSDLRGVNVNISSSESMSSEDTARVLMAVSLNLYKKLGLLPAE